RAGWPVPRLVARPERGVGRGPRSRRPSAAAAAAHLAQPLRPGAGRGGPELRHMGDRAARRRHVPPHGRARRARQGAEDRGQRLPGLDADPERHEDAARDRRTAPMNATMAPATATQVYQVFIKASPEQIWEAITTPEFTERYFYGARIETNAERRITHSPDDPSL